MRIYVNERRIKRMRRLGQVMFVVALLILIGSMAFFWVIPPDVQLENQVLFFWLSTLLLLVGLIAAVSAVRLTNDWVRIPRPEEALNEGLKGLGNNYALYHYYMPARHVLIAPQGVFCLEVRGQAGDFAVQGDRWRARAGILARLVRLFRQEQIGNPARDAHFHVQRLQTWINEVIPDSGIVVEPIVTFTNPGANFEAESPGVPVFYADSKREPDLRSYIVALGREADRPPLTREQRRLLDEAALAEGQ